MENAKDVLEKISNSLLLVLESLPRDSFEYDAAELIADYSHTKAKHINDRFANKRE